jgi:hypothetical protein
VTSLTPPLHSFFCWIVFHPLKLYVQAFNNLRPFLEHVFLHKKQMSVSGVRKCFGKLTRSARWLCPAILKKKGRRACKNHCKDARFSQWIWVFGHNWKHALSLSNKKKDPFFVTSLSPSFRIVWLSVWLCSHHEFLQSPGTNLLPNCWTPCSLFSYLAPNNVLTML